MIFQKLQSRSYLEFNCHPVSRYLKSLAEKGRVNPFRYLLLVLEDGFF